MSQQTYIELIGSFCQQKGLNTAAPLLNGGGIKLDDILFSFEHLPATSEDKLVIYCDLGPLPEKQREPVLRRLLEVNLYLCANQDVEKKSHSFFTLSPDSGHVILTETHVLEGMDAATFETHLEKLIGLAKTWRDNHFMKPGTTLRQQELSTPASFGLYI